MKNRIKKMNFQRQPRTLENEKSKGDKYMYQFRDTELKGQMNDEVFYRTTGRAQRSQHI